MIVVNGGDYQNGTLKTISDNLGNTYTKIYNGTGGGISLFFYYAPITTGGIGTLTVTTQNTTANAQFIAREYSGLVTSSILDVSAAGSATSGTILNTGTTATTGQSYELNIAAGRGAYGTANYIFDVNYSNGTFVENLIGNGGVSLQQDRIVSSTGQQFGTFIDKHNFFWTAAIATFKINTNVSHLIQSSGTAVTSLGSTSAVWGQNTTTGNLIVVGVAVTNALTLGTVTSITDAQSNIYIKAVSGTISEATSVIDTELWYCPNIIGGAGSVTVNHTSDNCAMYVREYSGNFNYLDGTAAANGSSTTPNSGTVASIAQANELIVVVTGDDKGASQAWTAAGGYGDMVGTATTLTGLSMEDNIVNATGAQTGTLTLGAAANWESLTATFRRISNPRYTPQGGGV
jgi:hypothetical protein